MSDFEPYNPLDKTNLGRSVGEALLGRKPRALSELQPFHGAGIYAIYYVGNCQAYATLSKRNRAGKFEVPIYVGKAVPAGARKGGVSKTGSRTKALYDRLVEHAESVAQAKTTLSLEHFFCRFLVVDDIWIPLGESLLIAKFSPVWNQIIDGFGNHDPGSGRYEGERPRWDVLHPGRPWAERCRPRAETQKDLIREVSEFLRATPIPPNPHFYAEQKLKEYGPGVEEEEE